MKIYPQKGVVFLFIPILIIGILIALGIFYFFYKKPPTTTNPTLPSTNTVSPPNLISPSQTYKGQTAVQNQHTAPAGKRFIRIQVLDGESLLWGFDGQNGRQYETPDSVLEMIKELNPDVLDRLYNGPIFDLNSPLRYRKTSGQLVNWQENQGSGNFPAGSVGSWLYQAVTGRTFYPRLGMDLYDSAGSQQFYSMAASLYDNMVKLGVPQERRFLDLDLYGTFYKRHKDQVEELFRNLYSQGWQGIGISEHAGFYPTNDIPDDIAPTFASFVCKIDPITQTINWRPDSSILSQLKTDKHLKLYILYIDFPRMAKEFLKLSPDEEADVLATLATLQAYDPKNPNETGFIYVYTVGQTFWDSKNRITLSTGKYKGVSLYQYMRDFLLPTYNPK